MVHSLPASVKGAYDVCWDAAGHPVSVDMVRTLDKAGINIQVNGSLYTGALGLGDAIAAPLVCLLAHTSAHSTCILDSTFLDDF